MVTKKNKASKGKKPGPNDKRTKHSQAAGFSKPAESLSQAKTTALKLEVVRRHQKRIENQVDLTQTGHRIIAGGRHYSSSSGLHTCVKHVSKQSLSSATKLQSWSSPKTICCG